MGIIIDSIHDFLDQNELGMNQTSYLLYYIAQALFTTLKFF